MLILHAGVVDGELLLWAEASAQDQPEPSAPRRRRPKAPPATANPWPYDAGDERLRQAVESSVPDLSVGRSAGGPRMIWLPAFGATPVPSSPLIAEVSASRAEPGLRPWWITAVPLAADQAIALLGAVDSRPTLAPGILVGRDLAYWAAALRLAGALVARQQFLPSLVQRNDAWRACWEPVIAGGDVKRVADAAKQMPPVARALSARDATDPPALPAQSVLTGFLTAMVDHLVRSTGGDVSSVTRPAGRQRGKSPQFDSLHDQWLHALRSPDGRMEGDAARLAELAEQIQRWRRPILMTAAAPMRLCFRLEEPEAEMPEEGDQATVAQLAAAQSATPWHVRYLLQAADDPSLLVAADDAWQQRGRKAAVLKRKGFQVQEYLLAALGQAAGMCPRIEASLKTAQPGGYEVDATGAHEFLTERAAALEQAGFGVLLPAWWTRKGTKLRLSVRANVKSPKMQGATGITLDALVNFRWEVALGDQPLSLAELETLAKLKQPLVKVRGQWVQMSAEEIQTALEFWKKRAPETATVRDVVKMALGADGATRDVDFAGVHADGWVADLLGKLEGTTAFEELATPPAFHGDLRPYQVRGYSWLAFLERWGLGACLADDMGLGKTVQTLALIQARWEAGNRRPTLLICPTSVVGNWQKEAARFTPDLPVMIHHGTTRAKQAAFKKAAAGQALVISSYALLHRDLAYLEDVDWAGVILDEAQNIKNPETKQSKAARTLKADCRIALTGTPVENHVGDLWSIMEFLNPGLLGTQTEFKQQFFVPIQAMRDPEATSRLKRLTNPFLLRRLKTDKQVIADLPDKQEMKVFCTLTKEQASLYTAVLKEAEETLADSEGIQRKGLILGMLSKLKQVCNHPAQFLGDNSAVAGRSGKLARLTEMLEELLEVGDRALLFSQFTEMGQILVRYLEETFGREVLFLHGGVPKRRRDAMVERFQTADGPPLFVLSLKAGGTGLNLTRANHVFHFDRWWNPAVENQATDRAFRIGQTRNVQVHKFLCVGTFEERIDEMIESKKEIAEQVVGAGEGWLTELSNRQLRDLFALRKEAVGT